MVMLIFNIHSQESLVAHHHCRQLYKLLRALRVTEIKTLRSNDKENGKTRTRTRRNKHPTSTARDWSPTCIGRLRREETPLFLLMPMEDEVPRNVHAAAMISEGPNHLHLITAHLVQDPCINSLL